MKSLEQLRRDARALKNDLEGGDANALHRLAVFNPRHDASVLKLADCLHVIARENGFESWPSLKQAVELEGMDKAARRQRLKSAIYAKQLKIIQQFLEDYPDIADGDFGLSISLYDREAVAAWLSKDPAIAQQTIGKATPLMHLAHSCALKIWPEREEDMLAIAQMLVDNGADINRGAPAYQGADHMLSPLYFAIGHSDNMPLGRYLLEQGADPNDGESLYHATELGHHEGLKLLLAHGANPVGTNALLRAMDFDDHEAVALLLAHGAQVDEFNADPVGGEQPWVIPALHQAARRLCGPAMINILLNAGADPLIKFEDCSAYGYARVFGHKLLASAIEDRGTQASLTPEEIILAKAADGEDLEGLAIAPERLPTAYRNILNELIRLPERLHHCQRLVGVGIEFDRPDTQGLTPVQIAGWEGVPEIMQWLLELGPDLEHVNNYGGKLLGTILHGAENCPERANRDHLGCLKLALAENVSVPRQSPDFVGDEDIVDLLREFISNNPDQVVEGRFA